MEIFTILILVPIKEFDNCFFIFYFWKMSGHTSKMSRNSVPRFPTFACLHICNLVSPTRDPELLTLIDVEISESWNDTASKTKIMTLIFIRNVIFSLVKLQSIAASPISIQWVFYKSEYIFIIQMLEHQGKWHIVWHIKFVFL